jgi:hypothetical protein
MKNEKLFILNEVLEKEGLDLKISISFLKEGNTNKMSVVSCNISNGYESTDYRFTLDITLEEIIADFIRKEN